MDGEPEQQGVAANELFHILRDGKARTRMELAALTGLARSTVAKRVDELIELGLVATVGDATSTGGRPSTLIALNPGARVVLSAQFGASHASVALIDLGSNVVAQHHEDIEISAGPHSSLRWMLEVGESLLVQTSTNPSDLIAVGIGLPGPVEHQSGRPKKPPIMPGWDEFDVPAFVRSRLDVPVRVDNDVNLMALGERASAGPEADYMMLVKVSTGIGSGIISQGMLQRGARGAAGDLGHISIPGHADILCACGNYGCLEAVAGGRAIAAHLRLQGLETYTVQDVVDSVKAGNPVATRALRQAGRDVGVALTACVNLLNPSLISLGGSLAHAGEHLLAGVREVVYAKSTPIATEHLVISVANSGDLAGMLGAGIMAISAALPSVPGRPVSDLEFAG